MVIKVVPYSSIWAKIFQEEANIIKDRLKDKCLDIYHIGSTSVYGLIAKPSVDILCIVDKLNDSLILEEVGFEFRGEMNVPLHYYFRKNKKINLHVTELDHGFIKLNLCFRNYLRAHQDIALQYKNLKIELLKNPNSHIKVDGKFSGYNLGKNQFIKSVLKKSNFNGYCVNFCMHDDEWSEYHRIREREIFQPIGVNYDRNHFSLKDCNHYHFVLYKGIVIVSVAHIELIDDKTAALRSLATDKKHKNKGYATYILTFLEKWLKLQKIEVIKTHANLEAKEFYTRLGYKQMTFNDKSISKNIIDLGKII